MEAAHIAEPRLRRDIDDAHVPAAWIPQAPQRRFQPPSTVLMPVSSTYTYQVLKSSFVFRLPGVGPPE
jgi:hypothetical protein